MQIPYIAYKLHTNDIQATYITYSLHSIYIPITCSLHMTWYELLFLSLCYICYIWFATLHTSYMFATYNLCKKMNSNKPTYATCNLHTISIRILFPHILYEINNAVHAAIFMCRYFVAHCRKLGTRDQDVFDTHPAARRHSLLAATTDQYINSEPRENEDAETKGGVKDTATYLLYTTTQATYWSHTDY